MDCSAVRCGRPPVASGGDNAAAATCARSGDPRSRGMTRRAGQPDTNADIELRGHLDRQPASCFVMVAGAGSGKTTSLVKALAHLSRTRAPDLRRRGQRVACITYTEVAVGEILSDVGDDALFHVSTIHSFLWTVVHSFQRDLRQWVGTRIMKRSPLRRQNWRIQEQG